MNPNSELPLSVDAHTPPPDPYPGLRPFMKEDQLIFFGREEHVEQIRVRLERGRFLAVVGLSGSGKSSLVRAGLVPVLYREGIQGTSSHWLIATMTPLGGDGPLRSLGKALRDEIGPHLSAQERDEWMTGVDATLRRRPQGLADVFASANLLPDRNLLVIVDQFEELFRVQDERSAERFVERILHATKTAGLQVFVVLTMRSEEVGKCANFPGLAEAVNAGAYLTPRLNRDQLEEAITGPANMCGGSVAGDLVPYLLNEIGDDQDQLPVLQHALMRCWNSDKKITREAFAAKGGVNALDCHANEVLTELIEKFGPEAEPLVKRIFQRITRWAPPDGVREPTTLKDIEDLCHPLECKSLTVRIVVERFRQPDCSFLTPRITHELHYHSSIDISTRV